MENTPNNNPLNTGNGVNPATTAAPAVPAPASTQAPSVTPTTPPPSMPVNITPGVVNTAANTETTASNLIDKAAKVKKYIIAGVASVALLTSIYVGYTFFKPSSDLVDTSTDLSDLNNKLSAPSAETTDSKPEETSANKEKLNEVVNELKDQYKTPETATSNPPGISIQLEDNTVLENTDAPKAVTTSTSTDTSSDASTPSTENPSQPDSTTDTEASSETSDSTSVPR